MGKGRGKRKKQSVIVKREEHDNEEDKDFAYRRSGIQQKSLKDEIEVEEASGNIKEGENMKVKNSSTENKSKRKRSVLVKEKIDPVKEENAINTKRNPDDDSEKPAGFRQNGSRRKNKPRRAAEAGQYNESIKNEWFNEDEDLYRMNHDKRDLDEKRKSKKKNAKIEYVATPAIFSHKGVESCCAIIQ